jgi:asparagine synthase (glutamine-hydrolysing)
MCGIAGIITQNSDAARGALGRMVAAQTHRGPDDQGQEVFAVGSAWLGLGQCRLSIIDLSEAGHQPMVHGGTGDQIVFNGEIYNFQTLRRELETAGAAFRGHSDTEVLLEALVHWGPDCIGRLEGMYAFAYYRRSDRKLLLARDPLGIKPLYVACLPDAFLFASEVRAILASGLVPRRLDRQAVAGFLAYGSVPEPLTIHEGIRAFTSGCWQWFDAQSPSQDPLEKPRRYWQFPQVDHALSERVVIPRLRETLDSAVHDHLVSDVPIGVFLSAGLDSTIVASLAARHTPQLRTFTIGFADQPDLSEAALAAETARRLGTVHTEIQINGKDAEASARRWLDSLDQPSVDGLNTYVISQAVRGQGIVVVLSGLGGDELFGGYSSFGRVPRMEQMVRRLNWLPRWGRTALSSVATIGRPVAVKEKAGDIARTQGSRLELFLQCRRIMSDAQLTTMGLRAAEEGLTPAFLAPTLMQDIEPTSSDQVAGLSQLESRFYMGNTLLRDSDTNGMAHSLEIRVPLLDRRILDLAYAIPGEVRIPGGVNNKHLLRIAFEDHLRPELAARSKTGFTLPIGHWIAGPMRDLCDSAIGQLEEHLDPAGVKAVWNGFVDGNDRTRWTRPFALCVLGHHVQRMGA